MYTVTLALQWIFAGFGLVGSFLRKKSCKHYHTKNTGSTQQDCLENLLYPDGILIPRKPISFRVLPQITSENVRKYRRKNRFCFQVWLHCLKKWGIFFLLFLSFRENETPHKIGWQLDDTTEGLKALYFRHNSCCEKI